MREGKISRADQLFTGEVEPSIEHGEKNNIALPIWNLFFFFALSTTYINYLCRLKNRIRRGSVVDPDPH